MTHPSPPDPFGPRQPKQGWREYGRSPYGPPAPAPRSRPETEPEPVPERNEEPDPEPAEQWPGYGPLGEGGRRGRGRRENGPHPRQGSPPPGFGAPPSGRHSQPGPPDGYPYTPPQAEPQDPYARSYGDQDPYGHQDPYQLSYGDQHPYERQAAYGEQPAYERQTAYGEQPAYERQAPYGAHDPYGRQDDHDPRHPYGGGVPHDPYGRQRHQDPYDLTATPFDRPHKRGRTLVVAFSAALGILLLGGGAVGAVSYLKASGDTPVALPNTGGKSAPSGDPRPSDEPAEAKAGGNPETTDNPKATDAPEAEDAASPRSGPTDPAPSPSTTSSSAAQPGSPIAHTEFDDWKFNLSGVKFDANKVGGWTYDTCEPVDAQGLLAENNCRRAVQLAYSAYRGHLKAVQVMLEFPSNKAAKTAAARMSKLTTDTVNIRRDMALPAFEYGKVRTNEAKNYVVVTIVTADRTAKAKADKFHLYLQADSVGYFLLRDVTITS